MTYKFHFSAQYVFQAPNERKVYSSSGDKFEIFVSKELLIYTFASTNTLWDLQNLQHLH